MPDLLADEVATPPVVATETAFEGQVWDIRRERFVLDGSELSREFMVHPGAVAVLALDERDRVLLIKQYRHPIRVRDWELPAGLLDIGGEAPLEAARRELAEEADLVAEDWAVLCDFWTSPGGSDEAIRVYLARGIVATSQRHPRVHEEAGIETRWVSLDEAVDAVLERRAGNAILSVAVLAAHLARDRGWSTLAPADSPWPGHPTAREH